MNIAIIITWAAIGILALTLLFGFLAGVVKGVKRSALHLLFFFMAIIVAYCIVSPVTDAILTISINGQTLNDYIFKMLPEQITSGSGVALDFALKLPLAIVSPFLFIIISILSYIIFSIIYLIVARLVFGKKKEDFKKHKPHRLLGGLFGAAEAFLFMVIFFSPFTCLTKTYQQITQVSVPAETQMLSSQSNEENSENGTNNQKHLQQIGEMIDGFLPKQVDDIIGAFNNSVIAKTGNLVGFDNFVFDMVSKIKVNGVSIQIRKEAVDLVETYNSVAVVYNTLSDGKITDIDLKDLKRNVTVVLNNGMFKGIVTPIAADYVKNFVMDSNEDENNDSDGGDQEQTAGQQVVAKQTTSVKQDDKTKNLGKEILLELKKKFSSEGFDAYEYLKHEILTVFDVAEKALSSKLVKENYNLKDPQAKEVLDIISKNSEEVKDIAKSAFSLYVLNDAFKPIINFASDTLADSIKKDNEGGNEGGEADNLLIALNSNVLPADFIDQLVDVVDEVKKLFDAVNLTEFSDAKDKIKYLTNLQDLDSALDTVANVVLAVRNMSILQVKDQNDETVFVLDNMVKSLGIVDTLFNTVDSAVESFTGVNPQTKTDSFMPRIAQVMDVVKELLPILPKDENAEEGGENDGSQSGGENADGKEKTNFDIAAIGSALDALAKESWNDGAKDGVFNNVFGTMIWYVTGDKITDITIPADAKPYESDSFTYREVKKYLNLNGDEYYTAYQTSYYSEKFKNINDSIKVASKVADIMDKIDLNNFDANQFAGDFKNVMTELEIDSDTIVEIVDNFKEMVDSGLAGSVTMDDIKLSEDMIANNGEDITNAIEEIFDEKAANAILELLGLLPAQNEDVAA